MKIQRKYLLSVAVVMLLGGCRGWEDEARDREMKTAQALERIRGDASKLRRFAVDLPKGADLHSHLSGALTMESLIRWGQRLGACVDTANKMNAVAPPCEGTKVPLANATEGSRLYQDVIAAWSVEGFNGTLAERHQHFFDAFGRFGYISGHPSLSGETLAEVMRIAAEQNHWYLELMLGLGGGSAGNLASRLMSPTETWTEQYLLAKRSELVADAGFRPIVEAAKADAQSRVDQARAFLGCDAGSPPPACGVDVRFIIQGSRTNTREYVFGQWVFGFELAQVSPLVVGVNLVQPEEHPNSLRYYEDEMFSLGVLKRLNEATPGRAPVHIALHAGELIPELLAEQDRRHLTFHIRRAVEVAGAERIGHGTGVLWETE